MINWREGKAGFVGASKRLIKGVFQFAHTLTSAGPTVAPIGAGILSVMNIAGAGGSSLMSTTGEGISSKMLLGAGVLSTMETDGIGVSSAMSTTGIGISSKAI